jgi:DNA primase
MAKLDYFAYFQKLLAKQGVWRAKHDELRCVCPLHAGASNRSSFMAMRDGRWHCFSCGAGGKIEDLVQKLFHVSRAQALELVGTPPASFTKIDAVPVLPPWGARKGPTECRALSEAEIAPYRRYCPNYLLNRGFSESILQRYEVGYDTQQSRIVIPARDAKGRLIGITYRRDFDDDTSMGKYWHEYWDKSQHLYGLHLLTKKVHKRLFLVEGQLDTVRMAQLGLPACAIMGSSLSRTQRDVLVRHIDCEKLILAFDNDDAGKHATETAIRMLAKSVFGPRVYLAKYEAKDPGELTERDKIRAVPWAKTIMPMEKPRACYSLPPRYTAAVS